MTGPVLNRRLMLERPARVPDGAGGWSTGWTALGSIWAHVRARGAGREAFSGGRERSRVSHRITVRAAPVGSDERPRADQRLRDGARVFRIRAVSEADERGRFLTVWADEEATP
ncbi:MAG: head-tail adaptor protein [Pseudomonadota bacterium]